MDDKSMKVLQSYLQWSKAISSTATDIGSKAFSSEIFSIEGGSGTSLSISILFRFRFSIQPLWMFRLKHNFNLHGNIWWTLKQKLNTRCDYSVMPWIRNAVEVNLHDKCMYSGGTVIDIISWRYNRQETVNASTHYQNTKLHIRNFWHDS